MSRDDEYLDSTGCLPNTTSGRVGCDECSITTTAGETMAVDCGKFHLCLGGPGLASTSVCRCAPAGCSPRTGLMPLSFDMVVAGDTAEGSLVGTLGTADSHNVHFAKDP